METNDAGFGDLLEQAEQLTTTIDTTGELPRVERNLKQLMEVSQQLWLRTAQTGIGKDASDAKASVLLGTKGISLQKISPKLDFVSLAKTLEPIEALPETDLEGFLRNERENAIISILEETRNTAFAEADKLYFGNLEAEWERQKQKILNSFVDSAQDTTRTPATVETFSTVPTYIKTRSAMNDIEIAYAKQIYIYNETIINSGIKPNLAERMSEVAHGLDDKNVIDLWSMVEYMIDIPVQFGQDTLASRISCSMHKAFISQARKYLEDVYVKYMKVTVYGNLRQAVLGGVPGTIHLVSSFLNIKLPSDNPCFEDGKVNGHPVWAMIYYSLRCGDLATAIQIANAGGPALEEFRSYLTEYVQDGERRLSPRSETLIRVMYKRAVQNSTDPFKKVVFCIVGYCDVKEDHSQVADKIDDYLWLKLSQIKVESPSESTAGDSLSLAQFQTKLLEDYGESHFHAYQQPYLYFQVLFLTAQFEAAIEFLAKVENLRCHAVHVAIVLFEAKILAFPQSINAQLLSKDPADISPMRRLNFVRLITLYTQKFESTDPREALQYFYFLRDLTGMKNENLLMACISELVLETKEYDMLLGYLENDGCRIPGLIDKFSGDTQKIIEAVATDSESRGMMEDAVKLYDLSKQHERVLDLLIKMLGPVVAQPSLQQSRRDRLHKMAVGIAERYKNLGHSASSDTTATFYLLLDLITFFDFYHVNKHKEALDVLKKLKLIPFQTEEVESYVTLFKELADEVRRCLPDVLLAAMSCLYSLYVATKSSSPSSPVVGVYFNSSNDGGQERYISQLQKQAQTLITFGGMLPYRMPGDTVARLVQKEILMH